MENINNSQKTFFELVRAGLWPDAESTDIRNQVFGEPIDWEEVYRLASEQAVLGLVLAGIDCLPNEQRPPKKLLLQWIGEIQLIEQQNKAMNEFVSWLIEKLRKEDVNAILVKGQGIAQCYNLPLWRISGDVDLLLNEANYDKAKKILLPLATEVEQELALFKHIGMMINDSFMVELHGMLHCRLSRRVDRVIDEAQKNVFSGVNVRSWQNGNTQVLLPGIDDDVIFLFTHILKHFYQGGVGLRQICDWCRFLWIYRSELDLRLLESRIRKMRLMCEWKAFGVFAMEHLGLPVGAMPLFNENDKPNHKMKRKAELIKDFVMEVGNFGHNRYSSNSRKYPLVARKAFSLWRRTNDSARHFFIFPVNSIRVWLHVLTTGIAVVVYGRRR